MPYLGPRSFETAPLTASNLSCLNSELGQRVNAPSSSEVTAKSTGVPLVCSKVPDEIISKEMKGSSSTSNQSSEFDSIQSSTSRDSSSRSADDELIVSTPLSSVSSTGSSSSLQTFDVPVNLPSRESTISQGDNQTIVGDDENKTIVSEKPTDLNLNNPALHFSMMVSKPTKHSSSSSSNLQRQSLGTPLKRIAKSFVDNTSSTKPHIQRPRLLRKKSGEPIKSSLKLPSLVRSESMPNSKSVRFAPQLADVKFFFRTEKPTAVSKETSPVHHVHSKKPVWDFGMSSGSSDEEEEDNDSLLGNEECWELVSNDSAPSKMDVNFARFSTGRPVVLESVKLNCSRTSLIGFVYVKNVAYQKKIVIRLTTDDWKSYMEVDSANYISSNHIFKYSDTSSSYDKFSFILKLDSICGNKPLVCVKYCVQYISGGHVYWDSNHGRNFSLMLKRAGSTTRGRVPGHHSSSRTSFSSVERSLFAPDDVGFKLKKNDNFNESFNSSEKFEFQPKKAKNYLLKKIQSESCISSLATHHLSVASLNAARIPRSARPASAIRSEFAPSIHYRKAFMSARKPSFAPHRPRPVAFGTVNDFNDYNQIVKNFCFCGSDTNPAGSSYNSPSHMNYAAAAAAGGRSLNNDFSSLCLS